MSRTPRLLRASIEDEIERLLTILDAIDGDPDSEPCLGWTEDLRASASPASDEFELESDFEDNDKIEVIAQVGAFPLNPKFQQFRHYRHEKDWAGRAVGDSA
ncbi:hypothetical protein LA66_00130 [Aureimonas altamirensis]|uniref:Uncharacterized protein n=1 Tax=Aureimonas altamirensis TaxID=370622 RepID=A0A0B1Q433_9HYPH|nr:hypothetical protein [Aureimonas altamirensis]KHJ55134.1 hypothetical protein LA66_00130 [Aureimonas altamirensis]